MKRIWASLVCAAMVGGGLNSGCGSQARLPERAEEKVPDNRPPDFALGVTVMGPTTPARAEEPAPSGDEWDAWDTGGEEPARTGAVLPRSLRPARYIMEADGVLRAAVGEGARTTIFPPQTRQLTPREMDALWRQLRATNLLASGNSGRIDGPEEAVRAPGRTTALIYVGYEGERRTVRILLDRGSEDAIAAERLVDRLAELAWVRDAYAAEDKVGRDEELDQSDRKNKRGNVEEERGGQHGGRRPR